MFGKKLSIFDKMHVLIHLFLMVQFMFIVATSGSITSDLTRCIIIAIVFISNIQNWVGKLEDKEV